jgi:hypothetical protein
VKAVKSYLTSAGFSHVHASVNDDYVSATAPVSTINQAFSVQMRRYQVTGAEGKQTTIESNDRDVTVPASISSRHSRGHRPEQQPAPACQRQHVRHRRGRLDVDRDVDRDGADVGRRGQGSGLLAVLGAEDKDDQPGVSRSDQGCDRGVRLLG